MIKRDSRQVTTDTDPSMTVTAPVGSDQDSVQPVKGGVASWACHVGFPPATIFPFTPPERMGIRNLYEFQALMYRPLYWLGCGGQPGVDHDLSLAYPPEWSDDGRSVTVTLKPWKWSNGEAICADNIMFWLNMMVVKGSRYGGYSPGYLPDNLTSYQKVADDAVRLNFDRAYSRTWVLMNQLTLITPMPQAWDHTAHDAPANASGDLADVPAVYDYLVAQNGAWTQETNEFRTTWPASRVWSVVNGPWRLRRFDLDGTVTFVPNEHYCGPNRPYLDEFRQVPTASDEEHFGLIQATPRAPGAPQVGFIPHGFPPEAPEHSRLVPQEIYLLNYMLLNFANPTVAGRLIAQTYIRQALQFSLDQDTAIRDTLHGSGYLTTGPVPAVPDSDRISPAQRANPMRFDIERARRLLAEHGWDVTRTPATCVRPGTGPGCAGAGIPEGTRLSFTVRYAQGRLALTQLMQQFKRDAARAGIELKLQDIDGSVLVGEDHSERTEDNPHLWELQTWNGGWVFYGHPTGEVLFKTGAGSNYGAYSDAQADELIDRTVISDDLEALYEYQDYLAEQVPVIWTPGFPLRVFAVDNNLRGFEPVNPYGMINPENWYYTSR